MYTIYVHMYIVRNLKKIFFENFEEVKSDDFCKTILHSGFTSVASSLFFQAYTLYRNIHVHLYCNNYVENNEHF